MAIGEALEWTILLIAVVNLAVDMGILYYVKMEYEERRELNLRLSRAYKAKRKRVNATQLVKAIVAQEVPEQ
jgi:hypothetical protein